MKNIWIKDLKPGTEVTDFFVLRKKEIKPFNGQKYLKLELGDSTGRIDAVLFENVEESYAEAEPGDIVKVKGMTVTYREGLEIKVEKLRKAKEGEEDPLDFLPKSEMDLGMLFENFLKKTEKIKNQHLKKLLGVILEDEKLTRKLKIAPAAKLWHHSYLGGLLEHTLKVAEFCEKAADLYELVDRDLLLTGALLHDIGKIYTYSIAGFVDYTDEGRLLGHIVSGDELVYQKIKKIEGFPENLALELRHLILSHQGELELASPVVPQTIEAIILHYADEMDAKAGAFSEIIKRETLQGKTGKKWSDWIPLIRRYIYLGEEMNKTVSSPLEEEKANDST
ncbi:MAG: HD domain-containing protein [candidate division Zixibacteria bacterium]|nr:HD domain-containing protein [candidate division Zixibacteria bacterium]